MAKTTKTTWTLEDFLRQWHVIEAAATGADYDRAELVRSAREAIPEVAAILKGPLELGPQRVAKLLEQVEALAVVPDRASWVAGGWLGVRYLIACAAGKRDALAKALRDAAHLRGGPLSKKGILRVIQERAPELIEVADAERERNGRSEQSGLLRRELLRLIAAKKLDAADVRVEVRALLGIELELATAK